MLIGAWHLFRFIFNAKFTLSEICNTYAFKKSTVCYLTRDGLKLIM